MTSDRVRDEIRDVLDRLGRLFDAGDLAVAELFSPTGAAMLVGSEPGEIVRGRGALSPFLNTLFDTGARIRWGWHTTDIFTEGETGWLFAEGEAVVRRDGEETRLPYRLSAVLVRENSKWQFRLFHGSEPKVTS